MAITGNGSTGELTASGLLYDLPTDCTISFWALIENNSGRHSAMGARGSTNSGWKIFVENGQTYWRFSFVGDATCAFSNTVTAGFGQWDHLCFVKSGTTLTPYLNGVAKTAATGTSYLAQVGAKRDHQILVFNEGTNNEQFDGSLADVAIWSTALGTEQIAALAAGANAEKIERASLDHFWRLHLNDLRDRAGGYHLATAGGLTDLPHPAIKRPGSRVPPKVTATGEVTLTGTPITNVDHTTSSSESLSIPTDCDAVLVISTGVWNSGTSSTLTALNWDASGNDFTTVIENATGADNSYDLCAYIMTATDGNWPGTGSQTLNWTHATTLTEGGTIVIVFLKGVKQASPIVDTDSERGSVGTPVDEWTASLSGLEAGDLSFIVAAEYESYGPGPDGNLNGQTELDQGDNDNAVDWAVGYKSGESAPTIDTNGTLTSHGRYTGFIAFAIAAAAAAPPETPTVKQFMLLGVG